ncbi:MAG: hypothetical protein WCS89_00330 [Candidatus Paceibacterota bacterium]
MKNISKKIVSVLLVVVFVISVSAPVFAQSSTGSNVPSTGGSTNSNASSQTFTLQNPLNPKINSIGGLIQTFVEIISYIAILFAVVAFIWVGFQYVTSAAQGKTSKIEELHGQLLWLVVGVAVIISARVIIQLTINTLSATGTISPGVINSAQNALRGN